MNAQKLQAETRTITGKAVKTVRQSGKLPATVYGKATNPLTISVDNGEFTKIFRETGETGLIELTVEGKAHPVLVHMVQTHPLTGQILHIEFHEVNLKEKVHAEIPVELTGEAVAIKEKVGMLLPLMDHIEVEALPTELPEKIMVDISDLAAVNDQILVGEVSVPSTVTVLTDPTLIIVKIGAFVVEKEPEPVASTEAEAAPTEGETTTEEKAPESKPEEKATE